MKHTRSETELDSMLARALAPPAPSADLHARVMAATAREAPPNIDLQFEQLHAEHARLLVQLSRNFRRESAQALIILACVFWPVRAGIRALLAGLVGVPSPILVGFLLCALAAAAVTMMVAPATNLRK